MKISSIFFWRRRRSRVATGGSIPRERVDTSDHIPVMLSPGRSTVRRPGETWSQAMNRLTDGKDL